MDAARRRRKAAITSMGKLVVWSLGADKVVTF
jgi:sulfur relay (sulfurtransferase) complex TusBCD TusD component (DsrE family)